MEMFEIVIYIVIGLSLIVFIWSKIHNKIKTYILRANSIEMEIDENLRNKYDLISKIKATTSENENVISEESEEIKQESFSSFEFERKLMIMEIELLTEQGKNKDCEDLFHKVASLNTKLNANKKYFNENVTEFNSFISKFPGKTVAKTMHYKLKKYFDGKDMYDENIKDFKI